MRRRLPPLVGAGLSIVAVVVLVALLAPVLSPHDPRALSGDSLEHPSAEHLLGTNDIGQDILSEVVWGARTSLIVAVGVPAIALGVALLIGVAAGLLGGWVDFVVTRLVDVFLAVPVLPLLILVAALAGSSLGTLVVVIGLVGWPRVARILRAQTLTLRQRGFVQAARGLGKGPAYVVRRHLVPALGPLLVANFVTIAGVAVLVEAGLSFLGLGDPTRVSWGQVLNRALAFPGIYFSSAWTWWALPAGLAITLTVLGLTFLGVGLEPALNPRWNRAT